jgi:hypothetical protein
VHVRQYKPRKESKTEEHYGGSKTTTVTWHADPVWRPVLHDDAGYYFNSNPLLLQSANMSSRSSAHSTTHSTADSATRILLQECGLTYLPVSTYPFRRYLAEYNSATGHSLSNASPVFSRLLALRDRCVPTC